MIEIDKDFKTYTVLLVVVIVLIAINLATIFNVFNLLDCRKKNLLFFPSFYFILLDRDWT